MRNIGHLAARLVIMLGVLLSGLSPAMAAPDGGGMNKDTMSMTMPGMPMDSQHRAPAKDMPCGGLDCGCCIGGACAMPVMAQTGQDIAFVQQPGAIHRNDDFLGGVTFPPAIRPPISRAATA
jgi:hypothetical protein